MATEAFEGWAIVELMGHRRLAGYVREVSQFGASMLRLDVPKPDGEGVTASQFYGGAALYCVTPTTEETARAVAKAAQPAPVQRWELPQLPPPRDAGPGRRADDDDDADEFGDEP